MYYAKLTHTKWRLLRHEPKVAIPLRSMYDMQARYLPAMQEACTMIEVHYRPLLGLSAPSQEAHHAHEPDMGSYNTFPAATPWLCPLSVFPNAQTIVISARRPRLANKVEWSTEDEYHMSFSQQLWWSSKHITAQGREKKGTREKVGAIIETTAHLHLELQCAKL